MYESYEVLCNRGILQKAVMSFVDFLYFLLVCNLHRIRLYSKNIEIPTKNDNLKNIGKSSTEVLMARSERLFDTLRRDILCLTEK